MLEDTLKIMGAEIPNYDPNTGIFYGAIAQNSLNPEVVSDILLGSDTRDLSYEEVLNDLNFKIDNAIEFNSLEEMYQISKEVIGDHKLNKYRLELIREILNHFKNKRFGAIKDILESEFNNSYENPGSPDFLYESEGYKIINCLDNYNFMILKSPYYTFAPECSPCVPCAGDLDSIFEDREYTKKTYCLGKDFYNEDEEPKFKIYKVSDDKEVS